jgi:hypothetical protein
MTILLQRIRGRWIAKWRERIRDIFGLLGDDPLIVSMQSGSDDILSNSYGFSVKKTVEDPYRSQIDEANPPKARELLKMEIVELGVHQLGGPCHS